MAWFRIVMRAAAEVNFPRRASIYGDNLVTVALRFSNQSGKPIDNLRITDSVCPALRTLIGG